MKPDIYQDLFSPSSDAAIAAINTQLALKADKKDILTSGGALIGEYHSATISGAYTLDWKKGTKQKLTLSGDVVLSLLSDSSFPSTSYTPQTRFVVTFVQGSGGGKFITTPSGITSYVTGGGFWINQQLDSLLADEEVTVEFWVDKTKGWMAQQKTQVLYYFELSSGSSQLLSSGNYAAFQGEQLFPGRWTLGGTAAFISNSGTVTGTIAECFFSTSGSNNANGQNLAKNTFRTAGMPTTNGSSNSIPVHVNDVAFGTTLIQIMKFRGVFTVSAIRVFGGYFMKLEI